MLVGSGIAGRGNKGSGLDIASLLKPSLGRGQLQVMISWIYFIIGWLSALKT